MLIKEEIDIAISVIEGIINLFVKIDDNARENPAVIALEKSIEVIRSVGL